MKKIFQIILLLFLVNLSLTNYAQIALKIGGLYQEKSNAIAKDKDGNIYITGTFQGTVDFNTTEESYELTSIANPENENSYDAFIAKYDGNANLQWGFSLGSGGANMAKTIVVDDSSNIFIGGYFEGIVDFDPSQNVVNENAGNGRNGFIAKYNSLGNFQWVKNIGNEETAPFEDNDLRFEEINDIALDIDGNVYITGVYDGTIDVDNSDGYDTDDTYISYLDLNDNPSRDFFAANYLSNGEFVIGFSRGGHKTDASNAIRVDSEYNIYIAGFFEDTCFFNINPNLPMYQLSNGQKDGFVAKYNLYNECIWAKKFGSTGDEQVNIGGLEIDGKNNFYIAGEFEGTVNMSLCGCSINNMISKGGKDFFAGKYDQYSNLKTYMFNGSVGNDGASKVGYDNKGNLFVAGWFSGPITFDTTQRNIQIIPYSQNGARDVFLAKYDNNSNISWVNHYGGAVNGTNFTQSITGMIIDDNSNLLTIGNFYSQSAFDPENDSNLIFNSSGMSDLFIVKFDSTGNIWKQPQFINNVNNNLNNLSVYPNPANDIINFSLDNIDSKFSIEIYDVFGKKLFSQVLDNQSSTNFNLTVREFNNGIYVLKINGKSRNYVSRFIINR